MDITAVKIKPYSIPLARELTVKTGRPKNRRGALVYLTDSTGCIGCGELAPLETLHKETLQEAMDQLERIPDFLVGTVISENFTEFTEDLESCLPFAMYPSVTCAIETAVLDIFKQQGRFDDLKNCRVPVNALLSIEDSDLCGSARDIVNRGFTSIKIKVGRSDFEEEIVAIKKITGLLKDKAVIRLDANRRWALKTALEFCSRVASPNIEYIEEPLRDINEIPEFTSNSKIPLALDETLCQMKLGEIKQLGNIAAFILKPSVLGGLKKSADLIRYARRNNITSVVSSAFETSVSLKAYAVFAAKMKLCDIAHGLDTLKFLDGDADDNPLKIFDGEIYLSTIIKPETGYDKIEAISNKLINAGVRADQRIAILSGNSADCMALILAIWNIGAVAVPLSTRYKTYQIKDAMEIVSCGKIFVDETFDCKTDFADALRIKDFADLGQNRIGGFSFGDFVFDLESDASIIFTSSSTGKPKAVLHTIANHYNSALGSNENIPFEEGDGWLMSLPIYHISGLSLIMRALINRASIFFQNSEETLSEAIKNPAVTHLSLVPAQLSTLLKSDESVKRLQKMKAILIGGSAVPEKLIKLSLQNSLPVFTSYGSTEMCSQVTTTGPGDLKKKTDSSGKLLAFRELKLTEDSEIIVKGKTLFKGYVKKDMLELPTDREGYFHTNDTGSLDCDGNLTVTGRKDMMFISGGENIHPREIEKAIEKIENVEQAIVIPTDDEKFGKVPVAFIKMYDQVPLNVKKIREELNKKLELFKIPKFIYPWRKDMQRK